MKGYFWIKTDEDICIDFCDSDKIYEIHKTHEENVSIVSKLIQYINITSEIEIKHIGKILFGAITFGELMNIIYDKDKKKRYELYEYNVRDELKSSSIKKDIIDIQYNNGTGI